MSYEDQDKKEDDQLDGNKASKRSSKSFAVGGVGQEKPTSVEDGHATASEGAVEDQFKGEEPAQFDDSGNIILLDPDEPTMSVVVAKVNAIVHICNKIIRVYNNS
ncbi:hypothetical protein LCGC14_0415990 [marine sediment metagenome]|uniref:Uncharacterized protein n=1 Tax=marine sediment metagenome TaxID=412755 RepID=A0A0F9W1M2_9ZZZZ